MAEKGKKNISTPSIQRNSNTAVIENGLDFFPSKGKGPGNPFFAKSRSGLQVQPKLTVNQPNDKYEREADMMADRVVQRVHDPKERLAQKTETGIQTKRMNSAFGNAPVVQKKCAACEAEEKEKKEEDQGKLKRKEIQRKPIFESRVDRNGDEPEIKRKAENTNWIQRKESQGPIVTPAVEDRLQATKGTGNPLPEGVRNEMESAYGKDFSNVRIHNDSSAGDLSSELNAQAFTMGGDIYFNRGKYDTESQSGKHLLAHELTHTIQQGASASKAVQRDPDDSKDAGAGPTDVSGAPPQSTTVPPPPPKPKSNATLPPEYPGASIGMPPVSSYDYVFTLLSDKELTPAFNKDVKWDFLDTDFTLFKFPTEIGVIMDLKGKVALGAEFHINVEPVYLRNIKVGLTSKQFWELAPYLLSAGFALGPLMPVSALQLYLMMRKIKQNRYWGEAALDFRATIGGSFNFEFSLAAEASFLNLFKIASLEAGIKAGASADVEAKANAKAQLEYNNGELNFDKMLDFESNFLLQMGIFAYLRTTILGWKYDLAKIGLQRDYTKELLGFSIGTPFQINSKNGNPKTEVDIPKVVEKVKKVAELFKNNATQNIHGDRPEKAGNLGQIQPPKDIISKGGNENAYEAGLGLDMVNERARLGYGDFDDFVGTNVAVFKYSILEPGADQSDNPVETRYAAAPNSKGKLHSETEIVKQMESEQRSYKNGRYIFKVTHVFSEKTPCSSCMTDLNVSTAFIKIKYSSIFWLVPYLSGTGKDKTKYLENIRQLIFKYGLTPPDLDVLKAKYETPAKKEGKPPPVQRKCDKCEHEDKIQRTHKEGEQDEVLQRKPIFESNSEEEKGQLLRRKCDRCETGGSIIPATPAPARIDRKEEKKEVKEKIPRPEQVVSLTTGSFIPSENISKYLEQEGNKGGEINVSFGPQATGKIKIFKKKEFFDTHSAQAIPLILDFLTPLRNIGLVPLVVIHIKQNIISGYLSVGKEKNPNPGNKEALIEEIKKNLKAFGWKGFDKIGGGNIVNDLEGGVIHLEAKDISLRVGGFANGTFNIGIKGKAVTAEGSAHLKISQLAEADFKFNRNEKGDLAGNGKLEVQKKNFTGSLAVQFINGAFDIQGKVHYTTEKLTGEVNILVTDAAKARYVALQQLEPEQINQQAAEAAGIKKPEEGPVEGPRAVAGWGELTFSFTDWLTGKAKVIIDNEWNVTITGEITPTAEVQLFPPQPYRSPSFIDIHPTFRYGIPHIADVHIGLDFEVYATAQIGPAKLKNIKAKGTYSTDPLIFNNFRLEATFIMTGFAALVLVFGAHAGVGILGFDIDLKGSISAMAGIKGYVEAVPVIGYREVADPQQGKKGEFFISGTAELAAQPFLQLIGTVGLFVDSPWPIPNYSKSWPMFSKEYALPGEFGVGITFGEYILGSGKWPNIEWGKVDFNPDKFTDDLLEDEMQKKQTHDKDGGKGFKDKMKGQDVGPPAPVLPEPTPPKKNRSGKPEPPSKSTLANWQNGTKALKQLKERRDQKPVVEQQLKRELNSIRSKFKYSQLEAMPSGQNWLIYAAMPGIDNRNSLIGIKGNIKPGETDSAAPKPEDVKKDGKGPDAKIEKTPQQIKEEKVTQGLHDLDLEDRKYLTNGEITKEEAEVVAHDIKQRHPVFTALRVVDGGETWDYEFEASRAKRHRGEKKDKGARPIFSIPSKVSAYKLYAQSDPLTKSAKKEGSADTIEIPGWEHARKLNVAKDPKNKGIGGNWKRGHKVSYRLGGKGNVTNNLVIIDGSANAAMAKIEVKVEGELNALLALKDTKHADYNKVMYYKMSHSVHGDELPMSAFGKNINITWGMMNANGTGRTINKEKPISSEKPPEKADEVKYSINNTSWDIFYEITKKKGIRLRFAHNLMRIRGDKKYRSFDDVSRRMIRDHDQNISEDTIKEQLPILEKLLDDDLNVTLK